MKFGVREICDVVLKAKSIQKVGNKVFYKDEPVMYFDSLKTSSMEGAATTVYAQGGRGNSRLIAWEGERTVTFTMEDALISPAGFSILSGAGLFQASDTNKIKVHTTEKTNKVTKDGTTVKVYVKEKPVDKDSTYVMRIYNDEVVTEPYIPANIGATAVASGDYKDLYEITLKTTDDVSSFSAGCIALVDYYIEKTSGYQIDITPDKFGGNYYLEASTLFRDTNGVDLPAEFIIPNCKIQSNFTFSMASSGDPSTFTFTMDAFPDYTRFDLTKKVLASIQILDVTSGAGTRSRTANPWTEGSGTQDAVRDKTWSEQEPAND